MTRVLLYDPYTVGHHLRYITIISEELIRQGYEVLFLTNMDIHPNWMKTINLDLTVKIRKHGSLKDALNFACDWMADVFHLCYLNTFNEIFFEISRNYPFEIYITNYHFPSILPNQSMGLKARNYCKLNQIILKKWLKFGIINGFIIHSIYPDYIKKMLFSSVKGLDKYKENIKITFDPSDGNYSNELTQEEARRRLNLPHNELLLLFFGLLTTSKGVDLLIKSLKKLEIDVNYKLLIVGAPGSLSKNEILSLIKQENVVDKVVHRIDFIDESLVKYYFMSADAILMPYKVYGYQFGTSGILVQGCSANKLIIATNVGIIGATIRHYSLGITVKPESVEELRRGIYEFLESFLNKKYNREEITVNTNHYTQLALYKNVSHSIYKFYNNKKNHLIDSKFGILGKFQLIILGLKKITLSILTKYTKQILDKNKLIISNISRIHSFKKNM